VVHIGPPQHRILTARLHLLIVHHLGPVVGVFSEWQPQQVVTQTEWLTW
jgi:hypothetical protein